MKVWVDDNRTPSNDEWVHCHSVKDAINIIKCYEINYMVDEILISLDHDAGDYAKDGGDYIKILDYLEEHHLVDSTYSFHLHTMNPVGRDNMRRIINKNHWREVIKI